MPIGRTSLIGRGAGQVYLHYDKAKAMKITTESQHHTLAFIDACNRSGYTPHRAEVVKWLKDPQPKIAGDIAGLFGRTIQEMLGNAVLGVPGEDAVEHLLRLGWLSGDETGLSLSPVGQALLGAAERSDLQIGEGSVVVLSGEDPFAYARLIGFIAKLGPVLLVDPYFRLDQFIQVVTNTAVDRVLISKQHKGSKEDIAALRVGLDSKSLPRSIELRASTDSALHDRMIVTKTGDVYTLGSSLSSIGSHTTVLTPVPSLGAQALQATAEKWWKDAEIIDPAKERENITVVAPSGGQLGEAKPADGKQKPPTSAS
ncbi:MAG: hypothetical protein JWN01_173 [Patescibacteria group bacterium]|nr:hypothetical protein [Patescibacteria group bacterium]